MKLRQYFAHYLWYNANYPVIALEKNWYFTAHVGLPYWEQRNTPIPSATIALYSHRKSNHFITFFSSHLLVEQSQIHMYPSRKPTTSSLICKPNMVAPSSWRCSGRNGEKFIHTSISATHVTEVTV